MTAAANHPPPERSKLPPRAASLAWEASEDLARLRARKRSLPLVLYVHADWSAASLTMERDTWAHPSILREAHRFVAFKLDVTSAEGDAELAAGRYAIQGVPSVIVFDAHGSEAARLTGVIGAEELLEAIRKASEH